MKSLYNISHEYQLLAEQMIDNDGELTPELQDLLSINKDELEVKAKNYGLVILEREAEIEIIKAEMKRLANAIKQRESLIERLKTNISGAMQLYGYDVIKTPLLKLSFRKSESVEIVNMAQIDQKYLVEKVTVTPDKTAIKNDIKAGVEVVGAVLNVNQNLQIK